MTKVAMELISSRVVLLTCLCVCAGVAHSEESIWRDWSPRSTVYKLPQGDHIFRGKILNDSFKVLLTENDTIFIGGRETLYNLYLSDLSLKVYYRWLTSTIDQFNSCRLRGNTDCDNYIRVVVRKAANLLYICGTYFYEPMCRIYNVPVTKWSPFVWMHSLAIGEDGIGICPVDSVSNATAISAGDKLYTATRTKADGRDPLILQSYNSTKRRTMDHNRFILSDPQFVSSFEKDDYVYFFFRENAEEAKNCDKAVFSRVGRVCKVDKGRGGLNKESLSSFFKARLSCSVPGEIPFYFNEIQSTTEFGQGIFGRGINKDERSDMIYGVFNTPENSIRGSAVCAFYYKDIARVFQGDFKTQDSQHFKWVRIYKPKDHPAQCVNDSRELSEETLKYTINSPLMFDAVPPAGGMPMLVFNSFRTRFTQIAVDWQVLAADGRYYDVVFVGTDNGRIIKAINKGGRGNHVESVVIEDLQTRNGKEPINSLKIVGRPANAKLLAVSRTMAEIIPLHRCERALSCDQCVALQDPYCSWNGNCTSAGSGLQSIPTGKHPECQSSGAPRV